MSSFQSSFLGVTAHWINDNWEQQDVTLGFEHLPGRHMSEALMEAFVNVVEHFNLQKKVMLITSDNGSNVLKMTTDFEAFTLVCPNEW